MDWEKLIDAARGLEEASPEMAETERYALMKRMAEAGAERAEEIELNRAKALVPKGAKKPRVIWARPLQTPTAEGFGFRSAASSARDLAYDFGHLALDLRIEPLGPSGAAMIAGAIQAEDPLRIKVLAGDAEAMCDEHGQFAVESSEPLAQITLIDTLTGLQYRAEL
jgi:hypothetical protein